MDYPQFCHNVTCGMTSTADKDAGRNQAKKSSVSYSLHRQLSINKSRVKPFQRKTGANRHRQKKLK